MTTPPTKALAGLEVVGYRYTFSDGTSEHFGRAPHPTSAYNITPLVTLSSATAAVAQARRDALEEAAKWLETQRNSVPATGE